MARPEKVDAVKEIAARFSDSDAVLLTEYRGLRVGEIAEVRGALRAADADYKVLKNTLTRIAVREVGLGDLVAMLEGPTAIAFVKGDAAAAAKALDDAARKFPVLTIKGGVLRGSVIDAASARALAAIEPRDVLLAKTAMLLNSPAQRAINVFAALLRDLGSMLAQVVDKKESGELPGGTGTTGASSGGSQASAMPEGGGPEARPRGEEPAEEPTGTGQTPGGQEQPEADEMGTPAPAELPEAEEQAAAAPESPAAEAEEVRQPDDDMGTAPAAPDDAEKEE